MGFSHLFGGDNLTKFHMGEAFVQIDRYSVPGVIGCMQALEVLKIAADVREPLSRRILLFDTLLCQGNLVFLQDGPRGSCYLDPSLYNRVS